MSEAALDFVEVLKLINEKMALPEEFVEIKKEDFMAAYRLMSPAEQVAARSRLKRNRQSAFRMAMPYIRRIHEGNEACRN